MKYILTLSVYFISLSLFSQTVVKDDDFSVDNGTFNVTQKENYATSIKDGHYVINVSKNGAYWFYNFFDLDATKDNFTVETTMELKGGDKTTYYGLAVGIYSNKSNYVNFYLNNEGNFFINHYYSEKIHDKVATKFSSAINTKGANTLKVERRYNICKYFINGTLVHQDADRNYYDNGFGVQVNGQGEVWVDKFKLTKDEYKIIMVDNAIMGRTKEDLGININTSHSELAPLVAADGKTLYFTRNEEGELKQDVWYSKLDANGNWGPAINMGKPINNTGNNYLVNASPDNNLIYLGNTYTETGEFLGVGISYSIKGTNGWNVPKALIIKDYKNVNKYSDYYPDLSNRFIITAIENDDSYGKKDLFISFRQEDGTYSKPLNMGKNINSIGEEFGPVLAADGKTLYFNSHGHTSYGSADVFMSKRLDETWTNWSEPKNLGPEINSDEWDGQISISADGKFGYISTSNGVADKSSNIFRFTLGSAAPEPVLLVYGKVLNSKTNEPLGATINYYDLSNNASMGTASSDPKDGSYKIILPVGRAYSFLAEKAGFYPISDNLDVTNLTAYTEIERNLYLTPVELGEVIRLNNLFFDTDKSDLKKSSEAELDRLVKFLNNNKSIEIQISGHTDDKGTNEHNQTLSQDRVNSVIKYLVNKGIDNSRLKGVGYGETKPIKTNETEEGRAQNRRVEFTILKK
jgi:outer membrane protein OmpA-like peptidoglycan-associated protein